MDARSCAVAAVALMATLFTHAAASQSTPRADRPDIKVGDTWTYESSDLATGQKRPTVTFSVESVADDSIVVHTPTQVETYTREWNMTEIRRGATPTFTAKPFWPRYQFPLDVGKQWESTFDTVSRSGERGYRWQWKVKVDGIEKVTVQAGTFETFRLRLDGFYSCTMGCNFSGRRVETIWYAPAVKRHVRTDYEETSPGYRDTRRLELVAYKPAS